MTHTSTPTPRHRTTHRLRRTVSFALVRGAAQATGTGLIGLLFWWITHK
jgi:hypothetical protein